MVQDPTVVTAGFQAMARNTSRSLFIEEVDGGFIVTDHAAGFPKRIASTRHKLAAIIRDWAAPAAKDPE